METPQTPQVRVPGETSESTQPEANATATTNHNSTEVREIQDLTTSQPVSTQEDVIIPDAQAEQEPPTPAKKNAGFNFLE
ncbi:hypothetical protein N7475_003216 [Penicillium sp. IBT 31633x]|nr:hypothetical protein N7475_003216 [Penicillium sp. IBT 31633x]